MPTYNEDGYSLFKLLYGILVNKIKVELDYMWHRFIQKHSTYNLHTCGFKVTI